MFSKIISYALKSVSGDLSLRPHHFRHGFATRALMPVFESNDSNYKIFLSKSLQEMDIKNIEIKSKDSWLPGRVSNALGHVYSATTLKWYAHIREGLFNQNTDVLSRIKDKPIAEILSIKASQYSQRRRRIDPVSGLKNHNAVYNYVKESVLPSLIGCSYQAYPKLKQLSVAKVIEKPSLIRIVEFVIGEMIHGSNSATIEQFNHGLPNDIAVCIRASMVFCSKGSALSEFNIFRKQENQAKLPELASLKRVHQWFSKNESLVKKLFSDDEKKRLIQICLRSILVASKNSVPTIVISEPEQVSYITFLLVVLGIEYDDSIVCRSTKKKVAEKFSGVKDKNAANKFAVLDSLKESGCEVVINFSDDVLKVRTFLQIIYILMIILILDRYENGPGLKID